MIRSALRTAVKDRLAIKSDGSDVSLDGLITNAFINTSINDALNRISTEKDWWWLQSSTTLTFDIVFGRASLPTNFIRARELVINSNVAQQIPLEVFIDQNNLIGVAYGWVVFGTYIKITPIPTASLGGTLYYFNSEPALSADSSSPLMPEAYQFLIVAYASYLCAARRQDEQRAGLYLQEYTNYLHSMRDDNRSVSKRRIRYNNARTYATWS